VWSTTLDSVAAPIPIFSSRCPACGHVRFTAAMKRLAKPTRHRLSGAHIVRVGFSWKFKGTLSTRERRNSTSEWKQPALLLVMDEPNAATVMGSPASRRRNSGSMPA
jgi:hypothetical protein